MTVGMTLVTVEASVGIMTGMEVTETLGIVTVGMTLVTVEASVGIMTGMEVTETLGTVTEFDGRFVSVGLKVRLPVGDTRLGDIRVVNDELGLAESLGDVIADGVLLREGVL